MSINSDRIELLNSYNDKKIKYSLMIFMTKTGRLWELELRYI